MQEIMSVARLSFSWNAQSQFEQFTVELRPQPAPGAVRHIGSARKPARCPECRSVIYSRRQRVCGLCGHPVPEELLFSPAEARRLEQLLDAERNRHRTWMERRNEEKMLR